MEINMDETYPPQTEMVSWDDKLEAILRNQFTQQEQIEALKTGVNTIGEMMNTISTAVGEMVQKVQEGGIGALLGGMMGKKNG